MSIFNGQEQALDNAQTTNIAGVDVRPLMKLVYLWMTLGILVTAVVSYLVATSPPLLSFAMGAYLPLLIGQFVLVIGLSWAIERISPAVASALFFVYAGSVGFTLAVIFALLMVQMDQGAATATIAKAFFTTSGLFGTMTVVGYTTKVDLSKYSSFFLMALIGLIIAMFVNMLFQSTMMDYVISIAGVLIFTALTAWDTQKIKQLAAQPEYQQYNDNTRRLAVMGALTLYLDFLNIFLFLLQLFAGGRD